MIINFAGIWNASMEASVARKIEPRSNCFASEIGQSFVTRWLKMKGVEPSNLPNPRSLRKFTAGLPLNGLLNLFYAGQGYYLKSNSILLTKFQGVCLRLGAWISSLAERLNLTKQCPQ